MKILVVYASLTGNTEEMAELVAKGAEEAGAQVVLKNVEDVQAAALADYDGIALGAYTWGDGELPEEFEAFYDELLEVSLAGKPAVAFGSGDTAYAHYCLSVDLIAARLEERGAVLVAPGLKVEYGPGATEKEQCRALGQSVAAACAALAQGS
jgi:flavodoxin I